MIPYPDCDRGSLYAQDRPLRSREGRERAVSVGDHVREIDRPVTVPAPLEDRRRDGYGGGDPAALEGDIRQGAHEPEIVRIPGVLLVRGLDHQLDPYPEPPPDRIGNGPIDGHHDRGQAGSDAQGFHLLPTSGEPAARLLCRRAGRPVHRGLRLRRAPR